MKLVIGSVIGILVIVLAYFAYISFGANEPQQKVEASIWIKKCGGNDDCKRSVKIHYDYCANSLSFEKPNTTGKSEAEIDKMQDDINEYYSLIKAEIEACLTEKIVNDRK